MSLTVKNFTVAINGKSIIQDLDLEIRPGKIHALMGPNGSGKSTLAQALMGSSEYQLGSKPGKAGNYEIKLNGKKINDLKPDERGKLGLFLAFQNPVAIPGVSVANLLRTAYQLRKSQTAKDKRQKTLYNPALSVWEFNEMLVKKAKDLDIPQEFLRKSANENFSGGEKKKLEMLQAAVLSPRYAVFDEIDTGLDVDALKIVAAGISNLKKEGTGVLVITHYLRILKYLKPDFVQIMVGGRIVDTGDMKLAQFVEKNGYKKWTVGNKARI